jgi:hypothetical protein
VVSVLGSRIHLLLAQQIFKGFYYDTCTLLTAQKIAMQEIKIFSL